MPKPIPLSDAQFAAVMAAAGPLQRQGDGDVHRAVALAQRAFFVPPALDTRLGVSKYNRRSHR